MFLIIPCQNVWACKFEMHHIECLHFLLNLCQWNNISLFEDYLQAVSLQHNVITCECVCVLRVLDHFVCVCVCAWGLMFGLSALAIICVDTSLWVVFGLNTRWSFFKSTHVTTVPPYIYVYFPFAFTQCCSLQKASQNDHLIFCDDNKQYISVSSNINDVKPNKDFHWMPIYSLETDRKHIIFTWGFFSICCDLLFGGYCPGLDRAAMGSEHKRLPRTGCPPGSTLV